MPTAARGRSGNFVAEPYGCVRSGFLPNQYVDTGPAVARGMTQGDGSMPEDTEWSTSSPAGDAGRGLDVDRLRSILGVPVARPAEAAPGGAPARSGRRRPAPPSARGHPRADPDRHRGPRGARPGRCRRPDLAVRRLPGPYAAARPPGRCAVAPGAGRAAGARAPPPSPRSWTRWRHGSVRRERDRTDRRVVRVHPRPPAVRVWRGRRRAPPAARPGRRSPPCGLYTVQCSARAPWVGCDGSVGPRDGGGPASRSRTVDGRRPRPAATVAVMAVRGLIMDYAGVLTDGAAMRDLPRRARAAGRPTALVSSAGSVSDEIAELFDVLVLGGAVGVVKPDPEVYRRTAALLGLTPGECVVVDDLAANIRGARAAGAVGVLARRPRHDDRGRRDPPGSLPTDTARSDSVDAARVVADRGSEPTGSSPAAGLPGRAARRAALRCRRAGR